MLKDPAPGVLARRLVVPLSRFNDNDIRSMDYDTWNSTRTVYLTKWEEKERFEKLVEDIECNGLRTKIEIMQRGENLNVADGHHRVVALKQLGWTHIPYRWFNVQRSWSRTRYERFRLPGPLEVKE